MKFWLKNPELFFKEWGRYNDTLYKQCLPDIIRLMIHFELRLIELVNTDIRNKKITDDDTIVWTIKFFSQELFRETISEWRDLKNNQLKWITNRFYSDNYDLINSICNKVLSLTTNK